MARLYRSSLSALPARADEALPQGGALLQRKVRDRASRIPARAARPAPRSLGASNYGPQLREKQKVKRIYGVLEQQFRKYFAQAERRKGITGENLLLQIAGATPRQRRLQSWVSRPRGRRLGSSSVTVTSRSTVARPRSISRPTRFDRMVR